MIAIFAILFTIMPQEYINMVMEEDYESAVEYCKKKMNETKGFKWYLELGDIYLEKLDNPIKAKEIYQDIIDKYPQKDGWVYYRLGLALEALEDYLSAAKAYEIVATRYRQQPLDSFSLSGVERCFKKNYQDTVAVVDGYRITRLELDDAMAKQSPFARRDERATLDQMILERLLYLQSLKNNVKAMKEYKNSIKQTRTTNLLDEVRAINVVEKAVPTEKEKREYYKKNKHFYKLSKEVRGKEIVVESESLALFIRDSLLKDQTSFDTLAKIYSTAPTKAGGGDLGIVIPGTKPKEVEDVLFNIKLNTISEIVKFEDKYGIYIVTERKPERWRSFDEVKSQVEASVRAEKIQKIEENFLKNIRAKAKIEIFKDSIITDTLLKSGTRVVASINGRPITFQDVENKNASQPMFAKLDISRPEEFEKVLESLIEEDLKLEIAERNKYYLNDGYITKFNEGKKRALEQALYTKIVIENAKVDSNEVKEHYKKNIEDMKIPETIRCKEIVVNSKDEAERIRRELAKHYGEKKSIIPFLSKKAKITDFAMFDSLAQAYSTAYNKSRGGDTGPLRRGARPKEFEDIAWKLKIGELSKVFLVGDSSWTILTKTEHSPTKYRTFDEVKGSIEMNLLREKQRKIADDFLAKIKNEADIRIFLPEPGRPEDEIKQPEAPEVVPEE